MNPSTSVVVVVHDMARELPRTLATLAPAYQRGIAASDYEVIVVDNGSSVPVDEAIARDLDVSLRVVRIDDAPASPARAANLGIELASAPLVGLVVDGARMASPGLLSWARRAATLAERPVVATLAWHLGPVRHMEAGAAGFDEAAEDALLASVPWERDGYRLFEISTLAGSSGRGWFGPLGECSALFMPRALWHELGGLDERFALPGGGLVNHDLFRRALGLAGVEQFVLLGEGTFHQQHGGAATGGRFGWQEMLDDYEAHRGEPFRPARQSPTYLGTVPTAVVPTVLESARLAMEREARRRDRSTTNAESPDQ